MVEDDGVGILDGVDSKRLSLIRQGKYRSKNTTSLVTMTLLSDGTQSRYAPGCSRDRPRLTVRIPLSPNVIFALPDVFLVAMARQPKGMIVMMLGCLPVSN